MATNDPGVPDWKWWNQNTTDNQKIKATNPTPTPVPCRICQEMFGRVTLTINYCNTCGCAFCNGVHGIFSILAGQPGRCVICYLRDAWNNRKPN